MCSNKYYTYSAGSSKKLFVIFCSPTDEDSPTDEAKALLADVRDQLLQGLADDAEAIRY